MGVWAFVVLYLAAFVLLQFVIYRYLRDHREEESRMAVSRPPNADRRARRDGDGSERRRVQETVERGGDEAFRRCPSCGATNEPDGPYTFCRNCATRLRG
jgi:hypothetical protein